MSQTGLEQWLPLTATLGILGGVVGTVRLVYPNMTHCETSPPGSQDTFALEVSFGGGVLQVDLWPSNVVCLSTP